jgi:hypothetical protein
VRWLQQFELIEHTGLHTYPRLYCCFVLQKKYEDKYGKYEKKYDDK